MHEDNLDCNEPGCDCDAFIWNGDPVTAKEVVNRLEKRSQPAQPARMMTLGEFMTGSKSTDIGAWISDQKAARKRLLDELGVDDITEEDLAAARQERLGHRLCEGSCLPSKRAR